MNTNTKILETLEKEIAENTRYTGYEGLFSKTIEMLRANIREETATKSGAKKPYKIIEKMLKSEQCKNNNMMQKAHKYNDKYGFLDGHRLFITDNDMGYEVADQEHTFRIEQLYNGIDTYDMAVIEIDIAEVRYFAKVAKGGKWESPKPYIIRTPDGFAGFNPNYLIDLIDFSGSNKIKYIKRNAPIHSENMNALLLPVNVRDFTEAEYQEYRAKWFSEKQEGREAA